MSTINIDKLRQDGRSLLLSTSKHFISNSNGVTGSETLGSRFSPSLRDLGDYTTTVKFSDVYTSVTLNSILLNMSSSRSSSTDVSSFANAYLNQTRRLTREDQKGTIVFSPKVYSFDPASGNDTLESEYSLKKFGRRMISGSLVPYYVTENQGKYFAVGNYFSLNFFTASCVRSDTAIAFPDFGTSPSYRVSTGLTIDLHINPRYTTDGIGSSFGAGSILHLPGCYSLTMVTGSSRGPDGLPDKFKLLLALTQSADFDPRKVDLNVSNGSRTGAQSYLFMSDDNILARNTWNHVSISWSSQTNNGFGKFWVNGQESGQFTVSLPNIDRSDAPGALIIGNHVTNSLDTGRLFNQAATTAEGLLPNNAYAAGDPSLTLACPLNAEIHSLKIYARAISPDERTKNEAEDTSINEDRLIFYMPPVFMHESPIRQMPVTMFDKLLMSSSHPVNVDLMFGCGGKDTNIENFIRNATQFGQLAAYPRLFNLTASLPSAYSDAERNFNTIYYGIQTNRKRNLTVLPCDDGLFRPSYACIASLTNPATTIYKSYMSALDYSQINLTGIVEPIPATMPVPVGQTRQDPGGARQQKDQGAYYQVQYEDQEEYFIFGTLIDVSTIHYGHKIKPGTFMISDSAITGSCEKVKITYVDDGKNGLYRADAQTAAAYWNTQGLMYTNEGMGIVLSPTVPFFGKTQWDMTFDTDSSIHVLTLDVVVPSQVANMSQNPTYKSFPPTTGSDDVGTDFVYIDTINLHDNNLNVVARGTLSQPVFKRPDEKFLFRLKMDF